MKGAIFKRLGDKSKIMTSSLPKYVPPLFSIVVLQKVLTISCPEQFNELLFKIGKSLGKLLSSHFKSSQNINQIELIKVSLREMAYMGFGRSEISIFNLTKNQIIIKNLNNPWAKQYKRTFGGQTKNMDFFISGIYSGVFSVALNNECLFEERSCISGGNSFCTFHFTLKNIFHSNYFDQNAIDSKLLEKNLITDKISTDPNDLIKKMFSLDQITSEEGGLKVWTIYCIMLPFEFYQVILDFLNKKISVENIFLYLGMIQSKIGVQFQVNKFGIKKGDDTFKSILNQLELFGLGKGKLIQHTDDALEVEFKDYIPLIQHKKMFSSKDFHPYYTIGLLLGMAKFSYDEDIKSYSVSAGKVLTVKIIFSKNKKESFFNDLKESIKNNEIKRIIEEKMKHQYYLN